MKTTWTEKDVAMFMVAAFVLALYAITQAQILLAAIMALGLLCIIPVGMLRRMMGYLIVTDVVFSLWLASIASITFAGLSTAAVAGLLYSLGSREIRAAWGSERLSFDGKTGYRDAFAALSGQVINWSKALIGAIRTGKVVAPVPLNVTWVEEQKAGGFEATLMYESGLATARFIKRGLVWLRDKIQGFWNGLDDPKEVYE